MTGNPEQIEIIRQGVKAWNAWRRANPTTQVDLSGVDLRGAHLENVDLTGAQLDHANLSHANLRGANLTHASLRKACLGLAELKNALLASSCCDGADFRAADLEDASFEDASLTKADLSHANLVRSIFICADLKDTNLMHTHLDGVRLEAANLDGTKVSSVGYDQKIFRKLLKKTRCRPHAIWHRRRDFLLDTTIRCKGVDVATCHGSQRFKRFLEDQDYLEELLDSKWGELVCFIWWVSANCGRSISRWTAWSCMIALTFALIYFHLGTSAFATEYLEFGFVTTLYYSVVTFTTLGFGDVTPKTSTAAMFVMTEVIIGYIMLGGLISIFASKLSRRSG